jgi:hypothetical protein
MTDVHHKGAPPSRREIVRELIGLFDDLTQAEIDEMILQSIPLDILLAFSERSARPGPDLDGKHRHRLMCIGYLQRVMEERLGVVVPGAGPT